MCRRRPPNGTTPAHGCPRTGVGIARFRFADETTATTEGDGGRTRGFSDHSVYGSVGAPVRSGVRGPSGEASRHGGRPREHARNPWDLGGNPKRAAGPGGTSAVCADLGRTGDARLSDVPFRGTGSRGATAGGRRRPGAPRRTRGAGTLCVPGRRHRPTRGTCPGDVRQPCQPGAVRERPHTVWSRPGSRACASPAGGRRPSGAVSAVGQEGVHASGSAESKVRASRGRTRADMLCSIMRRAASARSASMWATASGARLTSKCRMWASSAE